MIMVAVVAELLEEYAEVLAEIFNFTEQQLEYLVSPHTGSWPSLSYVAASSSSALASGSDGAADGSSFLVYF